MTKPTVSKHWRKLLLRVTSPLEWYTRALTNSHSVRFVSHFINDLMIWCCRWWVCATTATTTWQPSESPALPTHVSTSPSEEAAEFGPPTSTTNSPTSHTPAGASDARPTSGSSPVLGTSCPGNGDDPAKQLPLVTGDEDSKTAAVASARRLQVHWSHGRKRRASDDSHEVHCLFSNNHNLSTSPTQRDDMASRINFYSYNSDITI